MAINNINNTGKPTTVDTKQTQQQQQQVQQQQTQAKSAATPAARQDAVSITPQAQQLGQLTRKAGAESGIDQEKVNQVKQALADGSYKVDVERLAAKLAEFESDLYGS